MKSLTVASLIAVAAADTCYLPVDVYFLQDTTGSFIEDLPNVKAQIPSIISSINANNPGSYFGVGEFRDKPYLYLGELNDYCTKLNHPLSSDIPSVENAFARLFASGGGDLPEAQLAAIIDSVNDPLIGWRGLARGVSDGTVAGARLIIMSTDAKPHDPLDWDLYPGTTPAYMIPYPDNVAGISSNTLCRRYDYPSVDQMKAQLAAHNTYLAILTPDDDPEVTAKWRWINDDVLGNPSNFYQFIKNDSSDILNAIIAVLNSVTNYVCSLTTTTTEGIPTTLAPTTLPPVTEAPTTLPPVTEAPTTLPPVTEAPVTPAPVTEAPVTPAPVTEAPVTPAPVTEAPVTPAPVTEAPVTPAPVTEAPVTPAPVTEAPVTPAPVTEAPVTPAPVTEAPVTPAPVTEAPVTPAPVTEAPVTPAPVTEAPVTPAPVTEAPVTPAPVTEAPTTTYPDVTVTPVGTTESVCPPCPDHPGDHCQDSCYYHCHCCAKYGLVVKVNDRPKKLLIDYEK